MASEAQNVEETPRKGADSREDQAGIEFASRPSDLVPRVYEGGMKTWECSLDLAGFVVGEMAGVGELRGKTILEVSLLEFSRVNRH
jgi:protein-histidine N-methyltransferase